MIPKHPVEEKAAAWFHGALAVYYCLGAWFHLVSTWRHWRDRAPKGDDNGR